jgi:hypothetical protein
MFRGFHGAGVTEPGDDTFSRIEETQAALRDSIAQAKALAEQSDRLIRSRNGRTKREPEKGPAAEPGDGPS